MKIVRDNKKTDGKKTLGNNQASHPASPEGSPGTHSIHRNSSADGTNSIHRNSSADGTNSIHRNASDAKPPVDRAGSKLKKK